jgi:hypothetical protein
MPSLAWQATSLRIDERQHSPANSTRDTVVQLGRRHSLLLQSRQIGGDHSKQKDASKSAQPVLDH